MADGILAEIRASKKKFYVYILRKPDGTPFYVGMGRGERIQKHEWAAKNTTTKSHKLNVIRKVWESGLAIGKEIDSWHDTPESALAREAALILEIGRSDIGTGPLTNHTSGGMYPEFGPEHRQKLAAGIRAAWKDPALRAHMSKVMKDRASDPNYRRRLGATIRAWIQQNPELSEKYKVIRAKAMRTAAFRRRASQKTKADFMQPGRREKQVSAVKRYYASHPEVLAEMSARTTRLMENPELRATIGASRKRFNQENPILRQLNEANRLAALRSPTVRQKMAESTRQRLEKHPEHLESLMASTKTPEAKANHAAAQKRRFQNPDEREKTRRGGEAWRNARGVVRQRCDALLKKHGLSPPSGHASLKDWEEFEIKIRAIVNDYTN